MSSALLERPFQREEVRSDASSPIPLSATRVKLFLQCPRAFRYQYVDCIPTQLTGALAFGQVAHAVLHNLQQWSLAHGEPLNESVALYEFDRLWDEVVSTQNPLFKSNAELDEYTALSRLILAGYVEAHRDQPLPILLEYPFEILLQDADSGREYSLRGVIDRVDQTADGLVIVDYKTGKRKPSPKQLSEDLQLTIYAFAVRQMFGEEVQRVVYYHLRDQSALTVERDEATLHVLETQTLPQVAVGIAREEFAPRPGYYCRFCDHYQLCQQEGGVDLRRYEK